MRYSQDELGKNLISNEEQRYLNKLLSFKSEFEILNKGYPEGYDNPYARGTHYYQNRKEIDADIATLRAVKEIELLRRMDENKFWDSVDQSMIKCDEIIKECQKTIDENRERMAREEALRKAQSLQTLSSQDSPGNIKIKGKRIKKLVGYAALFNSMTYVDNYYEVVLPGAFTNSLKKMEVFCLWHHIQDQILGRTSSGTLKVWEDSKGLRFECITPDTQTGNDVVTLVERKDVRGCSFSFGVRPNDPTSVDIKFDPVLKRAVRYIKDVSLYEVTVTAYPAYLQTEVHVE